jgi:hypothetical protein
MADRALMFRIFLWWRSERTRRRKAEKLVRKAIIMCVDDFKDKGFLSLSEPLRQGQ